MQLTAQSFEGGRLLSRSDTGTTYVLHGDGTWEPSPIANTGGDVSDQPTPPKGLVAPARDFAKLWRQQQDDHKGIGWGLATERAMAGTVQDFAGGSLLATSDHEIVVIFADGHWESHHDVYKD